MNSADFPLFVLAVWMQSASFFDTEFSSVKNCSIEKWAGCQQDFLTYQVRVFVFVIYYSDG